MGKTLQVIKKRVKKYLGLEALGKFPDTPYPSVDLFYWVPQSGTNFGDELSRTIVELMLAKKGMTLFDEASKPRRLFAIGSILQLARDGDVVWGSGRHGSYSLENHDFTNLDVRAVRGPRTREFLKSKGISVPEIYGDPALLLPFLTNNRFVPSGQKDVALVPHLSDYKDAVDFSTIKIPVINPMQSWNKVVSEILEYKFIISSSLHGLIVAEAFGIPACFVRITEREDLFKYHDYYEGTGRTLPSFARSVPEAMEMKGSPPIKFDAEKLMNAFPYDLWG